MEIRNRGFETRAKSPSRAITSKGTYYWKRLINAQKWAEENGWPVDFIRDYEKGWAVQSGDSGNYAGPGGSPKQWEQIQTKRLEEPQNIKPNQTTRRTTKHQAKDEIMDQCAIKGCRSTDIDVIYYDRPVCTRHWEAHCDEHKRLDLKKEFHIKDKPRQPTVTDEDAPKKADSISERLHRIRAMRERNRR